MDPTRLFILLCCVSSALGLGCKPIAPHTATQRSPKRDPILGTLRLGELQSRIHTLVADDKARRFKSVQEVMIEAIKEGDRDEAGKNNVYSLLVLKDLEHWRNPESHPDEICLACIGQFASPDRRFPGGVRAWTGIAISFQGGPYWLTKGLEAQAASIKAAPDISVIDQRQLVREKYAKFSAAGRALANGQN